jgi:transposase
MSAIAIIGLDIAKNVFQVHAPPPMELPRSGGRLDEAKSSLLAFFAGLSPCLVGLEACFTAHFWAREIAKHGHEVRMIPPQYVKPFVKRNKTDSVDAEAICEAAGRPTMRFVAVKSVHQQGVLALRRARDLLVRQRAKLTGSARLSGRVRNRRSEGSMERDPSRSPTVGSRRDAGSRSPQGSGAGDDRSDSRFRLQDRPTAR